MTYSPGLLRAELIRDEGKRLKPYRCTEGFLTIGVGRNLEANGISEATARQMLEEDIADREAGLDRNAPWWRSLSDARQRALVNMAFQLGVTGLMEFKNTLAALQIGSYERAYREALDSEWAKQTPERAERVARMLREG